MTKCGCSVRCLLPWTSVCTTPILVLQLCKTQLDGIVLSRRTVLCTRVLAGHMGRGQEWEAPVSPVGRLNPGEALATVPMDPSGFPCS